MTRFMPGETAMSDHVSNYSALEQHDKGRVADSEQNRLALQDPHTQRAVPFGWWWEFGAIVLALLSTSAIIALVTMIDNQPISSWSLFIQPASLVAILSTIAKSALLLPIAVCLSQLKWNHFERPADLAHMQLFDDASRGPWGSLVFLWKTRGVAWLAGVGALITVLMTMFESFTQQAIHFEEKVVLLKNETGSIPFARTLSNDQFAYGAVLSAKVRLEFTIAMMEAMLDKSSVYTSAAKCPGKECRFPDFTSLAACASCETEAVQVNNEFGCTYYTSSLPNTTEGIVERIDYKEFKEFQDAASNDLGHGLSSYGMDCKKEKADFPPLHMNMEVQTSNETWALLRGLGQPQGSQGGLSEDYVFGNTYLHTNGSYFDTRFTGSSFRFCTSGYNGYVSPNNSAFDTIDTFSCLETWFDPGNISAPETFGQFPSNITHCRINFCAQEYANVLIRNDTLEIGSTKEKPLQRRETIDFGDIRATVDGVQGNFVIGSNARDKLTQAIETILYSDDFAEFMDQLTTRPDVGWAAVFEKIGIVATSYIRSNANADQLTGGGIVYASQQFFNITWGWLVMPFMMVCVSTGFLVVTATYSRRKKYLFKNSILAAILYGVNGWRPDETRKVENRVADTDLVRMVRGVKATLIVESEGRLKVVEE
ncbi:hypothetical protein BU25DRAFT_390852 [Macroventuria anomochaeta]|uniref:Uncharacterized protein n=1 Tax=Macroventuria anomochaeta TaxID=301207 RepID=A0ACB6S3M6_9PLEO|nr:uncharacterized protein BU25DRAFT_390852 [Macroventuria anomochaeta]KAF2628866.1 hypothetical protein BU25DRAFT_390852 [Macroventuria anomochaeta]